MRLATDQDFNNASRYLSMKIEIYFDGTASAPLTVTKADYLIDADWLEESGANSSNPFGAVSSNELSFRLFNRDGVFSPTNNTGPYYGKIKNGVLVIPYIKPEYDDEEVDWLQLGKYYITGWKAAITGTYADVVANDKWQQIFSSPIPNYQVEADIAIYQALTNIYNAMGYEVLVNSGLNKTLIYSFIEGTPLSFTQEFLAGALAYCTSNKAGQPVIEPYITDRITRLSLTDTNQIKTVQATQSISKTYDGVELSYAIPQGLDQEKIVDLQNVSAPSGAFTLDNISFTKGPLLRLTSVGIISLGDVRLQYYEATPWLISFVLSNSNEATYFNITAYGQLIGFTSMVIRDTVTKLLKVSSRYIQREGYAQQYKSILSAFVTNAIPTLSLSIRGNPLLNIGDRVVVQSDKYNLAYTGVIQRLHYTYAGGLSCEMELLNADILQGVL